MFKKTLASLVLAFAFLCTPPAEAAAKKCPPNSNTTEFMRLMVGRFPSLIIKRVDPEAHEKVKKYFAKLKKTKFKADTIYLGVDTNDRKVGFAMFQKDCLVKNSLIVLTYDEYNAMVQAVKLLNSELTLITQV